jgi:Trk K+ transport system NAD-binding subunit
MASDPANESSYIEQAKELCAEHTENSLHVRWVMRDALDRAVLIRAKSDVLDMFTTAPRPKLG